MVGLTGSPVRDAAECGGSVVASAGVVGSYCGKGLGDGLLRGDVKGILADFGGWLLTTLVEGTCVVIVDIIPTVVGVVFALESIWMGHFHMREGRAGGAKGA